MSNSSQYVEFLFLNFIQRGEFDDVAGGKEWLPVDQFESQFVAAVRQSLMEFGYDAGDNLSEIAKYHIDQMTHVGIISHEGDEYTGKFARFDVKAKDAYAKQALASSDVATRIGKLGENALRTALAALAAEEGWTAAQGAEDSAADETDAGELVDEQVLLPASDRFVTLDHNQRGELEEASTSLIDVLEKENSVDGDPTLRAWMLGQLKAGRELIRAQILNAWLLEQTLLNVLSKLIEKYKGQAIGAAAKTLLELLIKHIFGAS